MILSWAYLSIVALWGAINGAFLLPHIALLIIVLWFALVQTWRVRFPGRPAGEVVKTFSVLGLVGLAIGFPVELIARLIRHMLSN